MRTTNSLIDPSVMHHVEIVLSLISTNTVWGGGKDWSSLYHRPQCTEDILDPEFCPLINVMPSYGELNSNLLSNRMN